MECVVETKDKSPLKNITIYIPDLYCKVIDKLVRQGYLASRSEAVRIALRSFLKKTYRENTKMEIFNEMRWENH